MYLYMHHAIWLHMIAIHSICCKHFSVLNSNGSTRSAWSSCLVSSGPNQAAMFREVCSCSILGQCAQDFSSKDFFRRQSPHRRHHPASRCSQASAVEIPKDDSNIIQHPTVVVYFGAENIGRLENRKNLASHAFAVAEIVKSRGWHFVSKCWALLQVCTWDLSLSLFAAFFSASQIQLQAYGFYPKLTTNKLSRKQQVQMLNAVALRKLLLSVRFYPGFTIFILHCRPVLTYLGVAKLQNRGSPVSWGIPRYSNWF